MQSNIKYHDFVKERENEAVKGSIDNLIYDSYNKKFNDNYTKVLILNIIKYVFIFTIYYRIFWT